MDDLVEVRLTALQKKLIESIVAIPDQLEESLKKASKKARGTMHQIPYADLDQLAGWLAAEANYEESARRRQSLDRLYDEVQAALWEFDDRRIAQGKSTPVAPAESITRAKEAPAKSGKGTHRGH